MFGRLELSSLRETSPRVREVKKQHLVRTMWDRLCQPEAVCAIASTLFWIHMLPAPLALRYPPTGETLWRPYGSDTIKSSVPSTEREEQEHLRFYSC